jgi:hypothetical protein
LVLRPLFGLLYQPQMIDDECGAVGGMRIGRGNRSIQRKTAPVLLCPPETPNDLGSNPGRRCWNSVTNRLSCGTAYIQYYYQVMSALYLLFSKKVKVNLSLCLTN